MYNNNTDILIGNNILRFGSNIPKSKSGLYSLFDLTTIGVASVGINQIAYGNAIDGELTSNFLFVRDILGNIGIGNNAPVVKLHVAGSILADGLRSDDVAIGTYDLWPGLTNEIQTFFNATSKHLLLQYSNGGNVGVGSMLNPTAKLHAKSDNNLDSQYLAKFDSLSNNVMQLRNDGKVLVNQSTSNITDARLQVSGVTNEHGISYYANGLDNTSIGLGIFNQVLNNWSFRANKGGGLQQISTQDNYFQTTGNTSFNATGSGVFSYSKLNTFHTGQHGIAAMVDGTDDGMIGLGVLNTSTLLWKFRINKDGLIIAPYMPTSSAGLPTGALWNDAGTVKIA